MKIPGFAFLPRITFHIYLLLITFPITGQNGNLQKMNSFHDYQDSAISSLIDLRTDYIRSLYSERIEAPNELINGKEYEPYYLRSIFKPLLFSNKERSASIITNTRRYDNITLQYDTFLDEVIYTDISKTINYRFPQIALNKNIINGFNLYLREGFNLYIKEDSLTFRYLRPPECQIRNIKEGFYEIVYEEKSQYIIKHESTYYERQGLNNYKYSPKNYLSVGNEFVRVKNGRTLLKLFGEKSGEVKEFLKSSRIKVRKADKEQILSVIKFYDSVVASERSNE